MCFRPPTIEGATLTCASCGAEMPLDAKTCPVCGAVQAANAAAAPPPAPPGMGTPSAPGAPGTPGAPTAPSAPNATASSPTGAQAAPAEARAIWAAPGALPDSPRAPQVGGRIRTPRGLVATASGAAPEAPTGPGFEEAPDISNTGNYFTTGNYNNG